MITLRVGRTLAARIANRALLVVSLWGAWLVTSAHVGSPDVFHAGMAGPYDLRVTVRPPSVIPGTAEVTVRVAQGDVGSVVALPVFNRLGTKGAPKGDTLVRVPGPEAVFTGQVWVMLRGANTLVVSAQGPAGEGSLAVPLSVLSTAQLAMPRGTGASLAVLGVLLCIALGSLARAAVAEAKLAPGATPDPALRRRGRIAGMVTLPIVAFVLLGGAKWWETEDAAYRRRMYRALSVTGLVWEANGERMYTLTVNDSLWLSPRVGGPVLPDHGKMMHLFLVGENGAFAHLHPAMTDSISFMTSLPALPEGRYRVFADVVHESGFERTLATTLQLAPPSRLAAAKLDPDDGWSARVEPAVEGKAVLTGGATLERLEGTRPVVAGADARLRFALRERSGEAGRVEPYLGMPGHAVVMREDGRVYVHLHPSGTGSQASQAAFHARDRGDTTNDGRLRLETVTDPHAAHAAHAVTSAARTVEAGEIEFPYAFPSAGTYAVWVQLRRGGTVETARFDVTVLPASGDSR